jgi:hypothetical protein
MLQGERGQLRTVRAKNIDVLIESWGQMRACGHFRDMQRYSLLRSEWEQRAAAPAR